MSGTPLTRDDIFAKAKELRAAGVPLDEIDAYLTTKLSANAPAVAPPTAPHSKFTPAQLIGRANRQLANAQDEQDSVEPSYSQKALGGVAALVRSVPGAEVAQTGVRALVRGQSYRDARNDIRSAEDANPVSGVNSALGGTVAALTIPGAPWLQGARYGIAEGLTSSDPDADAKSRLRSAASQGLLGATVGKLAGEGAALRSRFARSRGVSAQAIPASPSPAAAPSALPSAPAAPTPADARTQLAKLLQKALDEGKPREPSTNWSLMDRMERGLAEGSSPSAARIIPRLRRAPGGDLGFLSP